MIRLYEQAREAAQQAEHENWDGGFRDARELRQIGLNAAISKTLELVEQECRSRANDVKPEHQDQRGYSFAAGKINALRVLADFLRHQREAK